MCARDLSSSLARLRSDFARAIDAGVVLPAQLVETVPFSEVANLEDLRDVTRNETDRDFVNFTSVADTVAEIVVQAAGRPISIRVSGAWGREVLSN